MLLNKPCRRSCTTHTVQQQGSSNCLDFCVHCVAAGNPPNLVQQIVDLSIASGVVSAHTTMLGFETTPEKYQQMQVKISFGTFVYLRSWVDLIGCPPCTVKSKQLSLSLCIQSSAILPAVYSPQASLSSVRDSTQTPAGGRPLADGSVLFVLVLQAVPPNERRKKIIKWAVGGAAGVAIVAGVAAALTFGDLASTFANMPVGDAMQAMGGDLGGFFDGLGDAFDCCGGDCGDCGGCDCCGDCGDLCGACLTC